MNNYCWFCGKKLNKNDIECQHCEAKVYNERVDVEKRNAEYNELKQKENKCFFITLLMPVCAYICICLDLAILSPLLLVAFLVGLVYLRKKHYYSLKIKILTSLVLIFIIVFIIFAIWICIECGIIHPGL